MKMGKEKIISFLYEKVEIDKNCKNFLNFTKSLELLKSWKKVLTKHKSTW